MISGSIGVAGTPIIPITVTGKETISVKGVLDTGFDGFLCLPIPIAVFLGLELIKVVKTELADGTIVEDELVFAGKADWDGTMIDVDILLTRSEDVLIGTAFLRGFLVSLNYEDYTVRIEGVSR